MSVLQAKDVVRAMREEWHARVKTLAEKVDIVVNAKVDGSEKEPVISPELKVRHKKSQIRYTVCSVGPRDVILRTPEEDKFLVDKNEFENSYELD